MEFRISRPRVLSLAMLIAFGGPFAGSLAAQTYSRAELSLIRVKFPPPDSSGVDDAFGFDIGGSLSLRDHWGYAFGFQYSKHFTSDTTGDISALGIYLEPRYSLRPVGRVTPYLAGRLGYLRTQQDLVLLDSNNEPFNGHAVQSGPMIGASAGALYAFTQRAHAHASVGIYQIIFGKVDFDGFPVGGSAYSGQSMVMRLGVSYDVGDPAKASSLRRRN